MIEYTWLAPLLPVVAFVLIIAFGRKLPGEGAYVAIAAMLTSLAISIIIAVQWFLLGAAHHYHELYPPSSPGCLWRTSISTWASAWTR